jgi:hypothetical protein
MIGAIRLTILLIKLNGPPPVISSLTYALTGGVLDASKTFSCEITPCC